VGEKESVYRSLAGKHVETARPRYRWEDNVEMDLKEIEWEDVDWIHLSEYRDRWQAFGNTVLNLQIT
jgi:hypothetical protein